jgi:hypothetical protein
MTRRDSYSYHNSRHVRPPRIVNQAERLGVVEPRVVGLVGGIVAHSAHVPDDRVLRGADAVGHGVARGVAGRWMRGAQRIDARDPLTLEVVKGGPESPEGKVHHFGSCGGGGGSGGGGGGDGCHGSVRERAGTAKV